MGEKYTNKGRVATAVMYCKVRLLVMAFKHVYLLLVILKVPERGGATIFTKADVFVKPRVGLATFFSYKGPDGSMDEGFTEHQGCPVISGEKMISTMWMREGRLFNLLLGIYL